MPFDYNEVVRTAVAPINNLAATIAQKGQEDRQNAFVTARDLARFAQEEKMQKQQETAMAERQREQDKALTARMIEEHKVALKNAKDIEDYKSLSAARQDASRRGLTFDDNTKLEDLNRMIRAEVNSKAYDGAVANIKQIQILDRQDASDFQRLSGNRNAEEVSRKSAQRLLADPAATSLLKKEQIEGLTNYAYNTNPSKQISPDQIRSTLLGSGFRDKTGIDRATSFQSALVKAQTDELGKTGGADAQQIIKSIQERDLMRNKLTSNITEAFSNPELAPKLYEFSQSQSTPTSSPAANPIAAFAAAKATDTPSQASENGALKAFSGSDFTKQLNQELADTKRSESEAEVQKQIDLLKAKSESLKNSLTDSPAALVYKQGFREPALLETLHGISSEKDSVDAQISNLQSQLKASREPQLKSLNASLTPGMVQNAPVVAPQSGPLSDPRISRIYDLIGVPGLTPQERVVMSDLGKQRGMTDYDMHQLVVAAMSGDDNARQQIQQSRAQAQAVLNGGAFRASLQ